MDGSYQTSHLVLSKVRVREEVSHPHKITIKIVFFRTVMIYHHDGGSRLLLNNWYTLNRPHGITPQKRAISWLFLRDLNLIR
jgi:hypothetical protein